MSIAGTHIELPGGMAARAEGAQLPLAIFRRLASSSATTTVRAAITTFIRDHVQRITLPRMSDEWLLRHDRETHGDI